MFVRLILGLVVLIAVLAALRHWRGRGGAEKPRAIDHKAVQCAHCGVYFPRPEAVVADGRTFCSRQHADQARR
ncbi:MAG: PP0621 family protein [Gammaproteobacteria bacterium]